ncbi:MAG TPA: nickel-dependent lactate racemase [Candidatus Limiplasma sp.]|nr:nickel-dependent lactate racemase [Candidatus Limiplasma sp.]HPS80407.1 nickel-dependent lactate racemase [Candidatus Limiplasma sp.]
MEQRFLFGYGNRTLPMTVRASQIDVLEATTPPPIADLREAFRAAVEENVIGSLPLRELIAPDDQVTVIVSDLTRAWMHQNRICPLLVDYLHEIVGLPYDRLVFLVALGTHRPQTETELRHIASDEVFERVRVINHDARQPLVNVGTTSRGTEVLVNPLAVGRKVILMGGTVHHLLAGYGGGRKSILPGIVGDRTIRQNHIHALHPTEPRSSDAVGCRLVEGNPVHEDMMEAARMVGPVFGINLVVDGNGDHIALPSGDFDKAWAESCRLVDRYNGVPIARKYDAVITACGGFPKDINLYQSSKTMINAYQAIREGGTLVFMSECREGGGPAAFFDWAKFQREGTLDAELRKNFTIAGYVFYVCVEIASHTQFHILSQIPPETVAPLHMHGHTDAAEIQKLLDFSGQTVAVMPHGSSTVPIFQKM